MRGQQASRAGEAAKVAWQIRVTSVRYVGDFSLYLKGSRKQQRMFTQGRAAAISAVAQIQ